jgi:hypothetical protein
MYFEYLTSMLLEKEKLILTSERGRVYALDIHTKAVRRIKAREPNKITAANAGERLGFAGKSRVGLSLQPGVAEFHRSAASRA